jgi:acyl carrier protein
MPNTNILLEVEKIFKTVFENDSISISETTSAKDIKNWDSMNHVLLIAEIEDHFGVEFELDDLIAINSVGDILSAIQSKTAAK